MNIIKFLIMIKTKRKTTLLTEKVKNYLKSIEKEKITK